MKLLLDQDVYDVTIQLLRQQGNDVVTASDLGRSRASDVELLEIAKEMHRILVTRDRDYGNLVFVDRVKSGVIYLRMLPSTLVLVHKELEHVLSSYTQAELDEAFVTVEPGRHRFRKI